MVVFIIFINDSFIPLSFIRGLVYVLLDRYFKICSPDHIFHSLVLKREEYFLNNCYPIAFFDRFVCIFFDQIFSPLHLAISLPLNASGISASHLLALILYKPKPSLSKFFLLDIYLDR